MESTSKNALLVKYFIWNKDSHGLFDFEANELEKGRTRLKYSSSIFMNKTNLVLGDESKSENEDLRKIMQVDLGESPSITSRH